MGAKQMNKAKTGANALGFVVLALGGVIAFNVIAARYFARVDFTQDKVYTLSQASKDYVSNLPDKLTIKAFISSDLQPPFSQVAQYTRDLLDEYAQASKGKIKWEVIDPGTDAKLEEEANKMKVPKMRRGRVSNNKLEIGANYLGVALQYQGNIESIPEVSSMEGLEFAITSLIRQMTAPKKKIAFAASEGELQAGGADPHGGGLQIVKQNMKEYEIVPVQLGQGDKPIPDDAVALVVAGPKQQFSERAKFVIDQFIMKGKSVAFLVDGMVVEEPRNMQMPGQQEQPRIGRKNDIGLEDLLEHYGFRIKDDIVLEPKQHMPYPVFIGGQFVGFNMAPPIIGTTKLAEKHAVMDQVNVLILPFASSIEKLKDKQPGLQVTDLALSTPDAWRQTGFYLFDPMARDFKIGDDRGPFTVAVAAEGKVTSFFAGKPYPNEKGEKVNPPDANSSAAPGTEAPAAESTGPARIVLIADSDFASDEYLRLGRAMPNLVANVQFFLNMLDWLAHNEGLSSLRAKGMKARPLTVSSDSTPTVTKFANIVGVPLVFIAFGVVRWRLRELRRKNLKL